MPRPIARRALEACAFAACLGFSCARPAPTPALPNARQGAASLPADLDVAVRMDVAALGREFGTALAQRLLLDTVGGGDDPSDSKLLEQALGRSELAWLGLRSGAPLDDAAKVLILRGHFAGLPLTGKSSVLGWTAVETESGLTRYLRTTTRPGAYARAYYPPGQELLIWASQQEVPAIEGKSTERSDAAGLRPPERGAVSLAARTERLRERYASRYPELVARFDGVTLLEAYVESSVAGWTAQVSLRFETSEQASNASPILQRLQQALGKNPCALGVVVRGAEISAFESHIRLSTRLDPKRLEAVKACILAEACCA